MSLHTASGWKFGVKRTGAKTLHAGRLNIGPRLILGFAVIIFSMLAADAVILWQFEVVRTQAGRLNDVDRKLVAVLRVHTSMLAFDDRLDMLAGAEDANRLRTEAGPLRNMVLEDIHRATSVFNLPPFDYRRDPTILPTLQVIQSALPSQLESITTLAKSGDWRAVHLRLANQVRPLESLTSSLVERVDREAAEQQAQTAQNIRRVQRLVFWIVPLTAIFTLLIAATLGVSITRSITRPLARLVEGSKALARGEFQHQVSVSGKDELAHLGRVFNDMARHLRDLYATLQGSEDRLRLVIDTIPASVWSARPDGSVDFINQRFLEFTGRSMEDMLGWGWGSLLHPDDLTRFMDEWQAALAGGKPMESEARARRTDGAYRWLLFRTVPLRDDARNIVKWYGTAIDIEERRQAEDGLRQSEVYLAEAQRLSRTGSWAWTVGAKRQFWSVETFKIFGFDPSSTPPTRENFLGRVHPDDRATIEAIEAELYQGNDAEYNYRVILPDGSMKYIASVAHPIRNEARRVVEFVGTVMDVTERKRAEEERERLRQVQADLAHLSRVTTMGELTASLAHEIKQPIAAAVTNAKTCLRWLAGDQCDVPEAREAAERIIKDVTRANDIISRIRLLFKKGAAQQELLDVNDVIEEMIILLRSEASRHSISIVSDLANNLPKIRADYVQLQQVFMNLMLNGIEAMVDRQPPGKLVVKSRPAENGEILISISDNGAGLSAEETQKIFNAFFTTKPHGTGMGLPISRSIIESHGGRLWATDNSPCGASFCFTLPTTSESHQ